MDDRAPTRYRRLADVVMLVTCAMLIMIGVLFALTKPWETMEQKLERARRSGCQVTLHAPGVWEVTCP